VRREQLQDDRDVSMELYVNKGRGYVESELHPADRSLPVDLVRIDAIVERDLASVGPLPARPQMQADAPSVVLDRVQDAGNVGSILRSAAASVR